MKNADYCPFTEKHIANLFEQQIWGKYRYVKREGHLPGQEASSEKRSHKKKPNSKRCVCFLFIQGSPSFTEQFNYHNFGHFFNFWTLPNLSERLNVRKLRCPKQFASEIKFICLSKKLNQLCAFNIRSKLRNFCQTSLRIGYLHIITKIYGNVFR